jgi:hypothetical protein
MIFGTPIASMACFLLAAFLGAAGQHLYRAGANASDGTLNGYVLNPKLFFGLLCYAAVMALFVAGFRLGGRITVLYPLYATTFIWAALISHTAQGTPLTPLNLAGMVLLMLSIGMVAAGGSQ